MLAAGCVISPQPLPPSIDVSKITAELTSSGPDIEVLDTVVLVGAPGAVSPGGAQLHAVNLDAGDGPIATVVSADGSFQVSRPGLPADVFRLRAFHDGLWSEPADLVVPVEDGPVGPPDLPLAECLALDPAGTIDLGPVPLASTAEGSLEVRNGCREAVRIEALVLLLGDGARRECDEVHASCITNTDPAGTPCEPPRAECGQACEDATTSCIDSGEVPEVCAAAHATCLEECDRELEACLDSYCQDLRTACLDAATPESQGFVVDAAVLPLTVPAGESRSVTVTFSPLRTGPAEDSLLVEIGSPERERRVVTLMAEGVGE